MNAYDILPWIIALVLPIIIFYAIPHCAFSRERIINAFPNRNVVVQLSVRAGDEIYFMQWNNVSVFKQRIKESYQQPPHHT